MREVNCSVKSVYSLRLLTQSHQSRKGWHARAKRAIYFERAPRPDATMQLIHTGRRFEGLTERLIF